MQVKTRVVLSGVGVIYHILPFPGARTPVNGPEGAQYNYRKRASYFVVAALSITTSQMSLLFCKTYNNFKTGII
jgi:hypothetical protein